MREAVWRSLVAFSVRRRVITIFSAPGDAEDLEMEEIPWGEAPSDSGGPWGYCPLEDGGFRCLGFLSSFLLHAVLPW